MAEHLYLVVLVMALATGLVASIVVTASMQVSQPLFFRYFLMNILLFNLLILSGLVFRYLQLQLQEPGLGHYTLLLPVLLVIMSALKLGWLYAFIIMNRTLPADIVPGTLAVSLAKAGSLIFLGFLGMTLIAWFMRHDALQQAAVILFESLIIGGALFAIIQLMQVATRLSADERRQSMLVFGGFYLVLLGIILVTLIIGWRLPGPQERAHLLANGGFLILFNLFPLIWIRWFKPLQPVSILEKFEVLGITAREREIIRLIQAGKTNQEIADVLFISVATVKDHNHNIFRKSNVRNRLELAKLFQ